MDIEKLAKTLGWIFAIFVFLLPVIIGAQSDSVWVGILVFAGILIALVCASSYFQNENLQAYLFLTALSFVSLGGAIWISKLSGGWWWTGVWLIVAFAHIGVVIDALHENDHHTRIALALAIFSILSAFLIPGVLRPILQGTEQLIVPAKFWMWATLVAALIFLGIAWYQGYKESEEKNFALLAGIGFILLLVATLLSKFEGGWWWTLPWAFAALVLWHAGQDLRQYYFGRGAGNFGVFLAVSCLLIGIGGPYLASRGWSLSNVVTQQSQPAPALSQADIAATQLANAIQTATAVAQPTTTPPMATASPTPLSTTTPAPTVTPNAPAEKPVVQVNLNFSAAWQALGAFLLAAVKSVWGIFHLFTFFALSYLWYRRWKGGVIALVSLLLIVWFAGAGNSGLDETLTFIFSVSPATWMKEMLLLSVQKSGSMVWGILLLGFLVSVGIAPVIRFSSKFNRAMRLHTGPDLTQSTIQRINLAFEVMNLRPFDRFVFSYLNLAVLTGLWIGLWIALREVAKMGTVPLGWMDLPDLTLPHWRPIWSWRYYIFGVPLWLSMLLLSSLQQKYDPLPKVYEGCLNGLVLFIAALLTVSFVPVGVTFFTIAVILSQVLLFPVRLVNMPEIGIQPPPIKSGILVWDSPVRLMTMLDRENSRWFLREDGDLIRQNGGIRNFRLPITQGQALFAFKEDQLLVLGNGKDVLWLAKQSGEVVKRAALSTPSDKAVLNPYQTMLAWVNTSAQVVNVLALESGKEFTLLSGVDLTPALAFSADGRHVAAGDSAGNIHIIDFSTRKTVAVLPPPESSQQDQAVRAIYGRKTGGWVAVYADRQVLVWDASDQPEKKIKPARKILAMDYHTETGRLALGMSNGTLQVFDQSLSKLFDGTVQEKEITAVCFSQDGRQVFTIGNKTEVRRIDL